MDPRVKKIVSQMTTTEKALMCVGRDFWFTRGIKRFGLEPYMVTDGPHGLRKQSQSADNLGINDSVKATCFPPACTMASTWNEELIQGVGKRMGEEAKDERVSIILGPGANIKRSPLCGRNFEYYSEDPYLTGKCAKSLINGIQSNGIGTSLKHFAVNNQEANRFRINAVLDERTLREIYLKGFQIAVEESNPATIMCSYNRINGKHASVNNHLLNEILRDEWGYSGYVMTDWGAVDNMVDGIKSGLDLEMPGGDESVKKIVAAVENGTLSEEVLNKTVERLVDFNIKASANKDFKYVYDRNEHHEYCRKVATEGAVLLKNDNHVLPLGKDKKILVVGGLFKTPRYQGSGSSLIKPNILSEIPTAFENAGINYEYEEGFSATSDAVDENAISKAVEKAQNGGFDTILVFAGLTMFYESEGFDREHMHLPPNQNELIARLATLGKNVVVVLYGGSPVEMPWVGKVKAILNMYLPGQAIGDATADILFGKVNPSGKLAETYPIKLEDNPSYKHFPEGPVTVEYREGPFVGYRYYNYANKDVLFPFGFGLSYTEFEYTNMNVKEDKDCFDVMVTLKNTGELAGKEAVQVYVGAPEDSKVIRTAPELKGFKKVFLQAGEEKAVSIRIKKSDLMYYNVAEKCWAYEDGEYKIFVGASSRDIKFSENVLIAQGETHICPYGDELLDEYKHFAGDVSDKAFETLIGYEIPKNAKDLTVAYMDTSIDEMANISTFGKLFRWAVLKVSAAGGKKGDENAKIMNNFMRRMMEGMTLASIANTNGGILPPSSVDGLILAINKHFFRGIYKVLKEMLINMKYDKELKKLEILERKIK